MYMYLYTVVPHLPDWCSRILLYRRRVNLLYFSIMIKLKVSCPEAEIRKHWHWHVQVIVIDKYAQASNSVPWFFKLWQLYIRCIVGVIWNSRYPPFAFNSVCYSRHENLLSKLLFTRRRLKDSDLYHITNKDYSYVLQLYVAASMGIVLFLARS